MALLTTAVQSVVKTSLPIYNFFFFIFCLFSVDPRSKSIMSLYETSSRGREGDETDSGLGSSSSQASSPATSSVSSVDTNTDDLIDFSSKTFPRAVRGKETRCTHVKTYSAGQYEQR